MPEENKNQTEKEGGGVVFRERRRLLFFGLPWTFTKYTITDDMITVDEGLFTVEENDCYTYKIQDVKLTATLPERMFGLGTITCYTGDVTNKELQFVHIRRAKEIKDYLLRASEEARLKRRTVNMQNIGADVDDVSEE